LNATRKHQTVAASVAVVGLWLLPTSALAAAADPADSLLSRPLALVVALALVSLAPFAFMGLTAFVKISTVLHIAKSAIGAQSVPSTSVVMALSAALTLLAMAPLTEDVGERLEPLMAQVAQPQGANNVELVGGVIEAIREPLRRFLKDNASSEELLRFHELARESRAPADRDAVNATDFSVIIPAFIISELVEAFMLGFAIFLPFLVVDLVVGNVLLALGMQMMSPTQVSLPFKLLLFVAADGWGLLSQTLVSSYQ
jgi:type III secretion protein R